MDSFIVNVDFDALNGDPSPTKKVTVASVGIDQDGQLVPIQVIDPIGKVIFDGETTFDLTEGVGHLELPAKNNFPIDFGFVITRSSGLTNKWQVPAQDPGVSVELSDFTASTSLPMLPTEYELALQAISALAEQLSEKQDADPDLGALAGQPSTPYGRALLALADQGELMGLLPSASTSVRGVVKLATNAQTATGTDLGLAVTPAGAKATYVRRWTPDTGYAAGDPALNPLGQLVVAAVDHTSGSVYDATKWTLTAGGSGLTPTGTKATDYAAVAGDLVLASASGGTRTITLPAGAPIGSVVAVKKTDSTTNLVNVVAASGETVEGGGSTNWATQSMVRRFVKDAGSNWIIDGGYFPSGSVTLATNQPLNLANYQQGDGDQAAYNRLMAVWLALSIKPEVFIPRGIYSFQSPIVMYSGLNLTAEGGGGAPLGTLVTITNKTTAMFDWPSGQNLIKGFNARGINFAGQPTRAATNSYTVPVFASTTKTMQYSNFSGCQFSCFTTFHAYFGGGTIRDCNFAHFNDTAVWLSGYDWTFDTNFVGVDVFTTVGKFYTTPALTSSATGGGLSDGTYYVQTTAVTPVGESDVTYQATTGTISRSIVLSAGTNTQSISLTTLTGGAIPDGTTGWNIYVSSTGAPGSFYRVNGGTPVANGATYTITAAPGSGTVPSPWAFGTTKAIMKVENCPNFTMKNAFPTITSGGPALHILNCTDGGYIDSFKADGYNVADVNQYGQLGAAILIQGSKLINIVGPRIHKAMGAYPSAPNAGAITIKDSSHIAITVPQFLDLPSGAPTIGFEGTVNDVTLNGAVYDTAGANSKGIRYDAPGATVTNFKWDEVPAPGPAGPPLFAAPSSWSSSTTYTYSTAGNNPSVTRNGSWYGLVSTSTNHDPAVDDGSHWVLLAQAGSSPIIQNFANAFGDGSDGAVNLNGTNTYAFFAKSGNVYTLSRDLLATDVTVAAGITLKTNGYLIQATGTTTVAAGGFIENVGGAGSSAGAAGAQSGSGLTYSPGGAGGVGNTGAGSAGANGAVGGSLGGTGGLGASGAGGANGAITSGSVQRLRNLWVMIAGVMMNAATARAIGGGSGGGGGGGDGTTKGGGGGGAGGMLCIITRALVNNGTIRANGANGGTPTTGNAGGGGGGGGGYVALFATAITGSGTATATAGVGGTGVGTGATGVTGNPGTVVSSVLI